MPTLLIEIEDTNLEQRRKRDGSGVYYVQNAYAHLVDRDGQPQRYPRQFWFFPPRDQGGNAVAVKPGQYIPGPKSFQVNNRGQLELNFIDLVPAKEPSK